MGTVGWSYSFNICRAICAYLAGLSDAPTITVFFITALFCIVYYCRLGHKCQTIRKQKSMEGMAIGTFPPLTLINLYFSPTKCPYNPYQEFGKDRKSVVYGKN